MTVTLVESTPLDYGPGRQPQRLAIFDHEAPPNDDEDAYFDVWPLVAFVDFTTTTGGGRTFIHYMAVRSDFRGRGLARQLVQYLYNLTDGDIDWGLIHADEAWHLYQSFREQNPDRFHRGKNRT